MPSTRSKGVPLAEPLDTAPKRRRGRSASIASTAASVADTPKAAQKRRRAAASVASSVVSEEHSQDSEAPSVVHMSTEMVVMEDEGEEEEVVRREERVRVSVPRKARTLRDKQLEEEVRRQKAARLADEAMRKDEERRDRAEKEFQTQLSRVAEEKEAEAEGDDAGAEEQNDCDDDASPSVKAQRSSKKPAEAKSEAQPASQAQSAPQATPQQPRTGLLGRFWGTLPSMSPWRSITPQRNMTQQPATHAVSRFRDEQERSTLETAKTTTQQPATQPNRKFREQETSDQAGSKTSQENNTKQTEQNEEPAQRNMEQHAQPDSNMEDAQPHEQSPTPAATKRKRAGSDPPAQQEAPSTAPRPHVSFETPSRDYSSTRDLFARTAPRPTRAGLIPKPTPRRTLKSVRMAREAQLATSNIPPTPAWLRSTAPPSAPRDKNADRRLQRLHEMQVLQQQQKDAEERLARLKAEEEAEKPARTKRVKVDELKWIPARRPGESSGVFRVPEWDSDDEMEVEEDVVMIDNAFEVAGVPEAAPKAKDVSTTPTVSPSKPTSASAKSLFPALAPAKSLFTATEPAGKTASPPAAVPELVPDVQEADVEVEEIDRSPSPELNEDEGWPEMPLAALVWGFTEKEKAEGLAMWEAGLAAMGYEKFGLMK